MWGGSPIQSPRRSIDGTNLTSTDTMQAGQEKSNLLAKFREKFDMFVFFHLGADAQIRIEEESDYCHVSIKHRRVNPFTFDILFAQIESLLQDPREFERFMLDQVTPHRR